MSHHPHKNTSNKDYGPTRETIRFDASLPNGNRYRLLRERPQLREGRPRFGVFTASLVGVEFLENPEYQGVKKELLVQMIPEGYEHDLIVVFDGRTAADPKLPLLVFDPVEEPGQSFRAYPPHIFTIETNLLVGNISFYEFERMLDENGIYSGYPHTAQEFDTGMEPSRIKSILESYPVSPPPKTLDIRQHIRYWLTRLIRKLYMR